MKVKEKGCIRNLIYESLILYTSGCVYTIRDNVLKDILSKNMAEVTDESERERLYREFNI